MHQQLHRTTTRPTAGHRSSGQQCGALRIPNAPGRSRTHHLLRTRAADDKNGGPPAPISNDKKPSTSSSSNGAGGGSNVDTKVEELLTELKNAGLTPAKAKELLRGWAKAGADEPKQLRELLVSRALQPLQVLLVQTLLDGAGAVGGFVIGSYIGDQQSFFGQLFFQVTANFVGCYYFLQAMIELSVFVTCVYSAFRYGSNSSEVLAAVRQLAEPSNLVAKATVAVSAVRVLQILEEIQVQLQTSCMAEQCQDGGEKGSTLQNLRAFLILSQAKEKLGFRPEKYNLSEKQAANIASCFARYDSNDNGRLELAEIGGLCESLGKTMSQEEVKEAVKVLDTNSNGTVDFEEWVAWWCKSQQVTSVSS